MIKLSSLKENNLGHGFKEASQAGVSAMDLITLKNSDSFNILFEPIVIALIITRRNIHHSYTQKGVNKIQSEESCENYYLWRTC